ncbi:MAG: hypothetical protein R3C59_16050 [Planctomycetaceae bacterium]
MGHDITATRPDVDLDALREEYRLDEHDEEWFERYQEYQRLTQIAYNRRSAGDALNQVLYLALGVMDEAYAGCSGNGTELEISLQQLQTAKEILAAKDFTRLTRERNQVDVLMLLFSGREGDKDASSGDISSEIEFIDDCLAFLKSSELPHVRIYFG